MAQQREIKTRKENASNAYLQIVEVAQLARALAFTRDVAGSNPVINPSLRSLSPERVATLKAQDSKSHGSKVQNRQGCK